MNSIEKKQYIMTEDQVRRLQEIISEEKATADQVYQQYYSDMDKNVFDAAVKADPTSRPGYTGKYTKWILNLAKHGNWKPSDTPETRDSLQLFAKFGGKLEKRDIQQYQSVAELYNAVQALHGNKTRSEVKADAEKVYEDGDWQVVVPKTMEAAQLYGSNTRWCTASKDGNNMFQYYNNDGPLYIVISKKDGNKWQFHFQSQQFMDSADEEIEDINDLANSGNIQGLKNFFRVLIGESSCMALFDEDRILENVNEEIDGTEGWGNSDESIGESVSRIMRYLKGTYDLTEVINEVLSTHPSEVFLNKERELGKTSLGYPIYIVSFYDYDEGQNAVNLMTNNTEQDIILCDSWFSEISQVNTIEGVAVTTDIYSEFENYLTLHGRLLLPKDVPYCCHWSNGCGVYLDERNYLSIVDLDGNVSKSPYRNLHPRPFEYNCNYALIYSEDQSRVNIINKQCEFMLDNWYWMTVQRGNDLFVHDDYDRMYKVSLVDGQIQSVDVSREDIESNKSKSYVMTEDQVRVLQQLNENRESKNINLARKYCIANGYDQQTAQEVIDNIRHDIPNSRLSDCKFLLGVTRMFLNGEVDDNQSIFELNNTLKFIATQAHVNEYNNDINGMSLQDIVDRFRTVVQNDYKQDVERSNKREFSAASSQYEIVRIPDFETASEYSQYTDWCVTQAPDNYDAYTNNGSGIFYFCLRNGFEGVPEETGENTPLDNYGLSMIAVSVNEDGSCNTITCRWNHQNEGNDNVMTPEQLEDVINMPFYKTFKPRPKEEYLGGLSSNANEALMYLNDEVGEYTREEVFSNPLKDDICVFDASGEVFDNEKIASILVKRGDDGNAELVYPYAIPHIVTDLYPSKNKYGYMIVTKDSNYYNITINVYNPDNFELVGVPENQRKASGMYSIGTKYYNAVLSKKHQLYFYDMENGECALQTEAEVLPYVASITGDGVFITKRTVDYKTGAMCLCDVYTHYAGQFKKFRKGQYYVRRCVGDVICLVDPSNTDAVYLYLGGLSNPPLGVNPVENFYPIGKLNGAIIKNGKTYRWVYYSGEIYEDQTLTPNPQSGYIETAHENYPPFYSAHVSGLTLKESVTVHQFQPKDELHPKFWINNKLNSRVRMKLLDIADDFIKDLNIRWVKPEDIVLTGSIANYNWTKYSDIDVHVVMDYKKIYEKTEFVKSYFDAKKEEWASQHENLKIYGFPVELYVEDSNTPAASSGVYSLEKNEWVKEPADISDAKINADYVKKESSKYMDQIDKLETKIKKEKDAKRVETLSNKMVSIFNKLKGLRKSGLKTKSKELSSGNIIWKILRAEGYIEKIWKIVNYNYDKQMSIYESKGHDVDFEIWKKHFDRYMMDGIYELQDDYLNEYGLKVEIVPDYNFGNKKWLASYIGSSGKIDQGIIPIAINYPLMYSEMKKRGIDKDEFNIEAQAKITVGHEIGHGICDYYYDIIDRSNEEDLVEEFGNYMFPDATGVWSSELLNRLAEYFGNEDNESLNESTVNYVTYYRGCSLGEASGEYSRPVLWLTDSPEYAELYAEQIESGVILEYELDFSKVRLAMGGTIEALVPEMDELDGPDDEQRQILLDNGYNAYMFNNTSGDEILVLLNRDPIVNTRLVGENELSDEDDAGEELNEAVTGTDKKQAAALYVYAKDKENGEWHVLCAKRHYFEDDPESNKWNPPMGHLHRGEDYLDGAIREANEESGIDFSEYKRKIKEMDSHTWGKNFSLIVKDKYTKDIQSGKGDEENSKFIWLPVSKIHGRTWAYTCEENAEKYAPEQKLNEGCWGPLPTQSDSSSDRQSEVIVKTMEVYADNIKNAKSNDDVYGAIGIAIIYLKNESGRYFESQIQESGLDQAIRDGINKIAKDDAWLKPYEDDCRKDMEMIISNLLDTYEAVISKGAMDSDSFQKKEDPHYEKLFLKESRDNPTLDDAEYIAYTWLEDDNVWEIDDCMDAHQSWMNIYPGEMTDDEVIQTFGDGTLQSMKNGEGSKLNDYYKLLPLDRERVMPEPTDINGINEYLKNLVGTTKNWEITGWILTDGTMLPYSNGYGYRDIDHDTYVNQIDGLGREKFMDLGAIRCFPYGNSNHFSVEIKKLPTTQQDAILRSIFSQVSSVNLDLRNGDDWAYYTTEKNDTTDDRAIMVKNEPSTLSATIKNFFRGNGRYTSNVQLFHQMDESVKGSSFTS